MKRNQLTLFLTFVAIFITNITIAQFVTNTTELMRISEEKALESAEKRAQAEKFAAENNIPVTFENDKGVFFELQYISEDGVPMYYKTDNSNSAKTISTNKVYPGGGAGLSLDGTGMTAREWDGGGVRLTHNEYGGRVVQGDSPSGTHWHATHVAGTIMAAGVNPSAKGMAYNGNLRAFDWNSDNSEMAAEAAAGALVSNHSYGFGRGWSWTGSGWQWYGTPSISNQEDYKFGFYDTEARNWDMIAANAPYYLIVKSAGNDRNEGPNGGQYPKDGPYDCIAHGGIAKNTLAVGAVHDIPGGYNNPGGVNMSSFSSWGPADDGRVKPDIVANGVGLFSTDDSHNASYTSSDGTSMSAPSVTGSLLLLQEHWQELNGIGNFMLASTLKGLVIHTADEAGIQNGPDYQFGWGLMNTKNAALRISEDQTINVIDEVVLPEGGEYEMILSVDGTEDVKVTICWTDVPGMPVSPQLDPLDPMLVNDLDLRVTNANNTYYPWKLNPLSPGSIATNDSENNVDNVEVVWIEAPEAGDYRVIIDHDGTLDGGSQVFSIIISGVTATISLPTATAGADIEACEDTPVQLNGASTNSDNSIWRTNGDGTFDDPTLLDAIYTFGVTDIETGSVDLELTAYGISPSTDSITDELTITVVGTPLADAGDDIPLCIAGPAQLQGVAENYESTIWSSRGDGSFDDPTKLDAIYTPGSGDIADGEVKLSLTALANEPCTEESKDDMYITFGAVPSATAGEDGTVCSSASYQLDGSAQDNDGVEWTTTGDGTFDDATLLNAVYTPGVNDIVNGNVGLVLTAFATPPCDTTGTDELSLDIVLVATADAGINDSICSEATFTVSGNAENYESTLWTSEGDGTFADATLLSTDYTPGTSDIDAGMVVLTLEVTPNAPCSEPITSEITLKVLDCSSIVENKDQLGFSIIPNPTDKQFSISFNEEVSEKVYVKIINISGNTVIDNEYNVIDQRFNVNISTEDIPSGVYTVMIKSESKVGVKRLIVQH